MNANDFISVEEILADLMIKVGDEEDILMFGRGFYLSEIQKAVEFFAMQTYYNLITKDIFDYDKNENGVFNLPTNCFGVKDIFLFNDCKEGENPDYKVVHWKRNLAYGKSGRKTARVGKDTSDTVLSPIYTRWTEKWNDGRAAVYANIQEGRIIFGDSARHYKNLRLTYYGFGSEQGTIPCIPRELREGIIGKAKIEIFGVLKVKDKKYRTDYVDAYNEFFGNSRDPGILKRCQRFVSSIDRFKRESMKEYFANADWI